MLVILLTFIFICSGFALESKLALPEGAVACAVVLGGSGPIDLDGTVGPSKYYKQLAEGLEKEGIATVRFSKRKGVVKNMHEELIEDAGKAIAIARKTELPLFLIGHSLGGILSPAIAKKYSVDGMVLIAITLREPQELILDQIRQLVPLNGERYRPLLERAEREKGGRVFLGRAKSYWDDWAWHAKQFPKMIEGPVLVVGVGNDYQTRPSDFTSIKKRMPELDFLWRPGLNHFFSTGDRFYAGKKQTIDPFMVKKIATWIKGKSCSQFQK